MVQIFTALIAVKMTRELNYGPVTIVVKRKKPLGRNLTTIVSTVESPTEKVKTPLIFKRFFHKIKKATTRVAFLISFNAMHKLFHDFLLHRCIVV